MQHWYCSDGRETYGPFTLEHLRRLRADGTLTDEVTVWREGWPAWRPCTEVSELRPPSVSVVRPAGRRRRAALAALALLLAAGLLMLVTKKTLEEMRGLSRERQTHMLVNWLRSNRTAAGLPTSFQALPPDTVVVFAGILSDSEVKNTIERVILNEGLVTYDGAVWQIVLSATGHPSDMALAERPLAHYAAGRIGTYLLRSGPPTFVYDPDRPALFRGNQGYLFKVINAHGRYYMRDPLDGKETLRGWPNGDRIHWEDWYPISGENAWIVMAALQIYHRKYFDTATHAFRAPADAIELKLSRELAECALALQAGNGGIRMGPLGTRRVQAPDTTWWYEEIATENTVSWYSAFRMLHQVTNDPRYRRAMDRIEHYMKWAYTPEEGVFAQGAHLHPDSGWVKNETFAVDCQTWTICSLRPDLIDAWFGPGTCANLWRRTRERAGFHQEGMLRGVGFTDEHDQLCVEWSAGGILATRMMAAHYGASASGVAEEMEADARTMREGIEDLYHEMGPETAAFSYSLKRKYIPFGWWAHEREVLSTVGTGWVVFMNSNFNPFWLGGVDNLLPPVE